MEMLLHPTKYCVVCISKQGPTGPISMDDATISQQYLQQLQNKVILAIQGVTQADTTFFQLDGAYQHSTNVILGTVHGVFDSCDL